jgi:putative endopeptidase
MVWRIKVRDESLQTQVLTNTHSTLMFSVSGHVSNIPGFYDAFHVESADPMYRRQHPGKKCGEVIM